MLHVACCIFLIQLTDLGLHFLHQFFELLRINTIFNSVQDRLHLDNKNKSGFVLYCARFALSLPLKVAMMLMLGK